MPHENQHPHPSEAPHLCAASAGEVANRSCCVHAEDGALRGALRDVEFRAHLPKNGASSAIDICILHAANCCMKDLGHAGLKIPIARRVELVIGGGHRSGPIPKHSECQISPRRHTECKGWCGEIGEKAHLPTKQSQKTQSESTRVINTQLTV